MRPPATICFPFVGDSLGGSVLSSLMLIESLDRLRFLPVIVVHKEGPLTDHLRQQFVQFDVLPITNFAGASPRLAEIALCAWRSRKPLMQFLKKNRVRIVHCNDLRMNLTWMLPARLTGTCMIWHQRTLTGGSWLWRLLPYLSDAVVAISKAVIQTLGPTGRRVHLVYNPFNFPEPPIPRSKARAELIELIEAPEDSRIIGFVGRLLPYKRPEFCVEMLPRLQKLIGKPVHIVFLGANDWGMGPALVARAEEFNLRDRIHLLGFRFPADRYLAGMDILVAPIANEAFGRAVVEAMVVGTPVVAANAGGHAEIIEDQFNGILVAVGNLDAFAQACAKILHDGAFEETITANAMTQARARYSRQTHVDKIQTIYADLLL